MQVRVPSTSTVVDSLRALVLRFPVRVVGGVVYGSVAKACHQPGSDIDALLITDRDITADLRRDVADIYRTFQLVLGFTPDDRYPVELFSLTECRRLLGVDLAASGSVRESRPLTAEDAWELLYALVTPHRLIIGQGLIDDLRDAAARRLVALHALTTPTDQERR